MSMMVELRAFFTIRIPASVKFFRYISINVLILSLMACEAPLVLDQVEQSKQSFTRRTDIFLAIGSNADDIVVVGSHGLVLVSNNDGESWQRQELPEWPALIDVAACANGNFAALSFEGDVWISEDRGETWQARKLGTEESPQAITCDSGNRLWVVGAFATISHSDDLGSNWSLSTTDEDIILNNIQFIGDNEAYISGEFGTLMKTTDRGANWEMLAPIKEDFYPQDMYFENDQSGWVIGLAGLVLHTSDGGQSWHMQETNTLVSLFRLAMSNETLIAVGGEGKIFSLNGDSWRELNHGKSIRLYLGGIEALQNDRIIVAGPAGILHILSVNEMVGKDADASVYIFEPNNNNKG